MWTRIVRNRHADSLDARVSFIRLSATAVAENSFKFVLQFTQFWALSGEEALHLEQVCIRELLSFSLFYRA
jgi:hypothetical protein